MQPACLVRFQPAGPWRLGPDSGQRDRVDSVLHSDTLYSAVTWAMEALGRIDEWLDATARAAGGPAVRFSSGFPFQEDVLFVIPPGHLWPPAPSLRTRWKGAKFVPLAAVESLLAGAALREEDWRVDGLSECLLPAAWAQGPFRRALRSNAAVDRASGEVAVHRTACLEFGPGAGLWAVAAFASEDARSQWAGPLRAAFRLLADSGLGGERSRGWGRSREPEFTDGELPGLLLSNLAPAPNGEAAEPAAEPQAHWLLSVFTPAAGDRVDWSRGSYTLVVRAGRMEAAGGAGALKRPARLVAEGSVLVSDGPITGCAPNAAPEGAPHAAYRAGFALALPVALKEASR